MQIGITRAFVGVNLAIVGAFVAIPFAFLGMQGELFESVGISFDFEQLFLDTKIKHVIQWFYLISESFV